MNQVSFNIYRLVPFVSVFDTDLVVVSSYFEDQVEIIKDANKLFKAKVYSQFKELKVMMEALAKDVKEIKEKDEVEGDKSITLGGLKQ